ncbi:MAG: efflux RND transporter periplasmic adaptor subunit [Proteobacteria bacterium]|nr:efflux RND transporter periplasmic adaptor subunit [Pseudomonadota bacterium]
MKRKTLTPRARVFGLAILALAGVAPLAACSPGNKSQSDTKVSNVTLTDAQRRHIRIFTVAQTTFHKTIDTTGVVDFDNDQATSVLAPISGPVSRLLVNPGDRVRKGQELAAVDSPDFAAAIGAYRKALVTAKTTRELADMDKDLLAHQGVARREAEQAQTDAASAEADRYAALQTLMSLNVDPKIIADVRKGRPIAHIEGAIRSPIAGTVVEKLVSPGQLLQAGSTACFTVADLSRMWVMAQIFGADLSSVHTGDSAQVEVDGGAQGLPGKVENIAALVNSDTRAVTVRVAVANPGEILKKQMYVRVHIQARQASTGLLVPASAILRDDENLPFVYVVQRDGSFARRHVTLGYRSGSRNDITQGLKAGEKIVVDGAIFVQFMQSQ